MSDYNNGRLAKNRPHPEQHPYWTLRATPFADKFSHRLSDYARSLERNWRDAAWSKDRSASRPRAAGRRTCASNRFGSNAAKGAPPRISALSNCLRGSGGNLCGRATEAGTRANQSIFWREFATTPSLTRVMVRGLAAPENWLRHSANAIEQRLRPARSNGSRKATDEMTPPPLMLNLANGSLNRRCANGSRCDPQLRFAVTGSTTGTQVHLRSARNGANGSCYSVALCSDRISKLLANRARLASVSLSAPLGWQSERRVAGLR